VDKKPTAAAFAFAFGKIKDGFILFEVDSFEFKNTEHLSL
jgi:hypothetical protein